MFIQHYHGDALPPKEGHDGYCYTYRRGLLRCLVLTTMGNAKASDSGASDWYRFLTPFFFIYVQQPDRQIRPLRGIGGQQTPVFGHMKKQNSGDIAINGDIRRLF